MMKISVELLKRCTSAGSGEIRHDPGVHGSCAGYGISGSTGSGMHWYRILTEPKNVLDKAVSEAV